MKSGTPRNDVFFKGSLEIERKVKNELGIESDCKIVLFAPTFRKSDDINLYILDFDSIVKALKDRFGGCWKMIIRLHPNVSDLFLPIEFNEKNDPQ